jgi:hypothetical protein
LKPQLNFCVVIVDGTKYQHLLGKPRFKFPLDEEVPLSDVLYFIGYEKSPNTSLEIDKFLSHVGDMVVGDFIAKSNVLLIPATKNLFEYFLSHFKD